MDWKLFCLFVVSLSKVKAKECDGDVIFKQLDGDSGQIMIRGMCQPSEKLQGTFNVNPTNVTMKPWYLCGKQVCEYQGSIKIGDSEDQVSATFAHWCKVPRTLVDKVFSISGQDSSTRNFWIKDFNRVCSVNHTYLGSDNFCQDNLGNLDPRLLCFDGPDLTGKLVKIDALAVPDLNATEYQFDNRIKSCKVNGAALLYTKPNFAEIKFVAGGNDSTFNLPENLGMNISSVRIARHNTLTFYEDYNLQGLGTDVYDETWVHSRPGGRNNHPRMNDFGKSVLLVGCVSFSIMGGRVTDPGFCVIPADSCVTWYNNNVRGISAVKQNCNNITVSQTFSNLTGNEVVSGGISI